MRENLVVLIGTIGLYLIASFVIAISLLPAYFFVTFMLRFNNVFLTLFSIAFSYFIFGITLMIIVAAIIRMFRIYLKPGVYKIGLNKESLIWLLNSGFISLVRFTFLPFTRTNINVFFYKMLGAKIGKNVIINTTCIYDPHLIEIGDNTIIGGDAVIIGHSAEDGKLIVAPVKIGKNVTIGQYSVILPGAKIDDGTIIGAMSLVPKNKRVKKGFWGGVPIRKIR